MDPSVLILFHPSGDLSRTLEAKETGKAVVHHHELRVLGIVGVGRGKQTITTGGGVVCGLVCFAAQGYAER